LKMKGCRPPWKSHGKHLGKLVWTVFVGYCVVFSQFPGMATIPAGYAEEASPAQEPSKLTQEWGVQVVAVRLSAAGYMVDFRYRITDSDKAANLLKRGQETFLLHEASGAKLPVSNSKLGPMRQTAVKPEANRIYFILFSNPATIVKPGDKVSVVIGDFKAEHLTVE
jgi:hypothetical protein